MSQNVIRPDEIKYDTLVSSESLLPTPRASIDSHRHNTGSKTVCTHSKMTNKSLATDPIHTITISTTVMTPPTPKYHKAIPPAIQTTSLHSQNNSSSTVSKSSTSSSTPLSTSTSSGGSSTNSPMSHIRRWTSNLSSSSKKHQQESPSSSRPNSKGSAKGRTIGPISAPQPLTTPAPYACTPLPYFDSPTSPVSAMSPLNMEASAPRSPAKPATSCPDLPTGAQSSEFSVVKTSATTYSTLGKNHRTSWKDRLLYPTWKKQDMRVSTSSNEDDDYDWSSQECDINSNSNPNATIASRSTNRPKIRISAPLTQPILPANQKTVPIIPAPLMSPTDKLFGSDVFDPFKIAPKKKYDESRERQLTSDAARSILDTLITRDAPDSEEAMGVLSQEEPGSQYILPSKPLERVNEDSDSTKPQGLTKIDQCSSSENKEGAVTDFAASICKGPGSNFVMPPSYFGQHKLGCDADEPYPRSVEEDTPKLRSSLRGGFNHQRYASDASSTYSTSSESSTESTDSDSSDSSESSDSSQSSPISGASFFSSRPNCASGPPKAPTLIKPCAIRIPASLMTLLPTGVGKGRSSPPNTPPATPPLEIDESSKELKSHPAPAAASAPIDPRALMLKRLAYIHTLKKLRERERRPFRHAVLLHLILLQLRRGIAGKQCDEIGDFYTTMWTAQFPVKWDVTNPMSLTQRQQSLQKQDQSQESLKPVGTPGVKELKPKRSLVLSFQNRIQSSKVQSGGNEANNGGSSPVLEDSNAASARPTFCPSPQPAPIGAAQTQASSIKARLPILRMPSYPLINLEKKNTTTATNIPVPAPLRRTPGMSFTPIRPNGSNSSDSEDDESEDEDSDNDKNVVDLASGTSTKQYEPIKPAPTIIIPKRTTGRKGLLYQQQQQIQIQLHQQLASQNELSASPFSSNSMGQFEDQNLLNTEQGKTLMQAQLLGARPRFSTSTYTTIFNGQSELVTKPLVAPPAIEAKPASNGPWKHHAAMSPASAQSYGIHSARMSHYEQPSTMIPSEENGGVNSAPAGLLTPPLSPLFRPSLTVPTSTGSLPSPPLSSIQNPASYLPPSSRAPQMHSYFPADMSRVPSPSFSTSIASPSVHVQHPHHTFGYVENHGQHIHRTSSGSQSSLNSFRQYPLQLKSSVEKNTKVTAQPALPSPPLSPVMVSETTVGASVTADSVKAASVRASSGPLLRDHQVSGGSIGGHAWVTRTVQEIRTRQSLDDTRSASRKQQNQPKKKNGITVEEEDVPLALVQRRISTDMLRSTV
ncbi:hypothetical protein BGX26_002650 [Mortierella sp. AD094]|nr:hypothetical protein BGX26_002650 [Mortierella sp. AD094]